MAKIIDTVQGYSFRFDQRAKGQETPYWVGTIFKDGKRVGTFHNDGNGGETIIHPFSLRDDLENAVKEEIRKEGFDRENLDNIHELYSVLIEFADIKGYEKGSSNISFDQYVQEVIEHFLQVKSFLSKLPKFAKVKNI